MGREAVTMQASARVSRHNSEQDALDGEAWNNFVNDVRMLAGQYETRDGLDIMVSGGDIYYHGKDE